MRNAYFEELNLCPPNIDDYSDLGGLYDMVFYHQQLHYQQHGPCSFGVLKGKYFFFATALHLGFSKFRLQ